MDDVALLTQVRASRCFNAIGISILVYDHLLSVDDEVEYVWKARMSIPKVSFLLVRYLVPGALFVNIYQQSYNNISLPDMSNIPSSDLNNISSGTSCRAWLYVAAASFVVVVGIENFLILLRVWVLNKRKRNIMKWTSLFYLVMQTMTIGWTIAIVIKAADSMRFSGSREFHTLLCSTQNRSILPALYSPPVLFEAVMIVLILCGTHVHLGNMENKSLMRYLMNDGFVYIMLLFFLRLANMLVTASAPARLIFTGLCFGCATSAATVSRLILSMRKESVTKRRLGMSNQGPMEALALPVSVMPCPQQEIAMQGSWSTKENNQHDENRAS